ncbi:MAG: hydrogenase maturation protease [Phycisphaerae bacterium]|nr:hydrogenase maturation protease [Phycisphaerae bacterium]
MVSPGRKVLVIGYGNPGRLDDGLGPALAEVLARRSLPGVTVDADYQLTVEDAAAVAEHDLVVFADAAVSGTAPFWVRRVMPAAQWSFSTHSVEPECVLGMAREMFGVTTPGYAMGIRGYAFDEFGEGLSPHARANLEAAAAYLELALQNGDIREVGHGPVKGRPVRTPALHGDA